MKKRLIAIFAMILIVSIALIGCTDDARIRNTMRSVDDNYRLEISLRSSTGEATEIFERDGDRFCQTITEKGSSNSIYYEVVGNQVIYYQYNKKSEQWEDETKALSDFDLYGTAVRYAMTAFLNATGDKFDKNCVQEDREWRLKSDVIKQITDNKDATCKLIYDDRCVNLIFELGARYEKVSIKKVGGVKVTMPKVGEDK